MDPSREVLNKVMESGRKEEVSRRRIDRDEKDINDLAEVFIRNFHNSLKKEREESSRRFYERKN